MLERAVTSNMSISVCVLNVWQGKVSVNTTNVGLNSVNTQTEFYFLPLHVPVLTGPSSGSIMIVWLQLFEFQNMDSYLMRHIHIINLCLS
jgi:small neutral amino acid transporter SnatA (MarC family)